MCPVKLTLYFEFHLNFAVTFFSIFTGIYIFNKGSVEKQKEISLLAWWAGWRTRTLSSIKVGFCSYYSKQAGWKKCLKSTHKSAHSLLVSLSVSFQNAFQIVQIKFKWNWKCIYCPFGSLLYAPVNDWDLK